MAVIAIVVMGVIVFALRFSFFAVPNKPMPRVVQRALYYVLPAVLMAMIVPMAILDSHGGFRPVLNPYLIGVGVGFGVAAWRKDNFFLIFGASVVAFAVAKMVLG